MIKINLALRKQAATLDTREKTGMKSIQIDSDAFKAVLENSHVRKLVLVVVVAALGTYMLNGYEADQLSLLDQKLTQANADAAKLHASVVKTTGYETIQKQIDSDEELIKTKLETIQKLSSDRQVTPKLLSSFVDLVPNSVWITELSMTDTDVEIKGSALNLDAVTDFMNSLGKSEYISGVNLGDSEKMPTGAYTSFEIGVKRK